MAERTTIARPYAVAAFGVAQEKKVLKQWSEMLMLAAHVAAHPDVGRLLGNPRVTRADLAVMICDIAGERFTTEMRNFVAVLADNRRLSCLPEIAALFEALRAEAERTVEAKVISAYPLDDGAKQRLIGSLAKKLGRSVSLVCEVDPSLIGGAIIRAGDLVIDGSARGQVDRLASVMSH
jgi:F-type H+-transporting ATPase subunit delta